MLISSLLICIDVPHAIFSLSGCPFCSKFCWYEFSSGSWGGLDSNCHWSCCRRADVFATSRRDESKIRAGWKCISQDGLPWGVSPPVSHFLLELFLIIRCWSVLLVPNWTAVFLGELFLFNCLTECLLCVDVSAECKFSQQVLFHA